MNFLTQFFHVFLYQPLLNILLLFYHYVTWRDLGLAVILLTIIIRLVLHPLSRKSIKSQQEMQRLQPKISEVQGKFKNDKNTQGRALMELYQREKVNPFSGCLPLLLQLPILIALYRVFMDILNPKILGASLYRFVSNPGDIKPTLLFFINLEKPIILIIIALSAGIAQFFQTKALLPQKKQSLPAKTINGNDQFGRALQQQMTYFFPILTVLMIWQFKALIGLYWLFSTLASIVEQRISLRQINKSKNEQ